MQRNDNISGRWPVRLIMLLLGVPSLGFAIVSGLFNASYAARLGHEQHEQAAWIAASVLITSFVTGLPLAIEVLRARVPHLAAAVILSSASLLPKRSSPSWRLLRRFLFASVRSIDLLVKFITAF